MREADPDGPEGPADPARDRRAQPRIEAVHRDRTQDSRWLTASTNSQVPAFKVIGAISVWSVG